MGKLRKEPSVKLNFIMNVLLTMSSVIFPLITYPYTSRVLQAAGIGKVSYASSIISYFALFAQLGIPTYGIRACAKIRDNKEELTQTVRELFLLNSITTLISYFVLFISLAFVPRFQEYKILYVIESATILMNTIGMEWLFKSLEKYSYITIRSLIIKIICVISMFLFVHSQDDFIIYGSISVIASSASSIFNFFYARKFLGKGKIRPYDLKKHLKPVLVFFGMVCATSIYTHLDTVMLGSMMDDAAVGYYNSAVKMRTLCLSIVTSLGTVLLPRASYYVEKGAMDVFWRLIKKSANFVMVLALPIAVYLTLFAEPCIYFFCGETYTNSILPMQVIMPTVLFVGLSNVTGIQVLIPLGKEKIVLYSEVAGAVVDFVLNIIFIKLYGVAGAALGTLVAEIVVLIFQCFSIKKDILSAFSEIQYIKIIPAILLSSAVASIFYLTSMNYFFTLLCSGMTFLLVYGLILILTKEKITTEITKQVLDKATKLIGKLSRKGETK